MKKYLFFIIINLLFSHNAYSENGDDKSIIKSGFVTVLNCEYDSEFHGYVTEEEIGLPGIAGGFGGDCYDASDTEYTIDLVGFGPGYRSFNDFGEFTLTVASINPFGSIEGLYIGADASLGAIVGVAGGLFVGELGTKYITIGDVVTLDDYDEDYVSLFARIGGFYLTKK